MLARAFRRMNIHFHKAQYRPEQPVNRVRYAVPTLYAAALDKILKSARPPGADDLFGAGISPKTSTTEVARTGICHMF